MATNGSVTVKVTEYDNLVFTWELIGQDIADNTSTVSWKMSLVAGSSGAIVSNVQKAWTVVVNGTKYTGTTTTNIGNNQTKVLASGSTTITHASDGSKTFAFSFKQVFTGLVFSGVAITDKSGSGSGTLPTITRASQPSCVTWPNHTQQVGEFGDEIAIHMNRQSSAFTHTVRYAFGSTSGVIARNVGTGTTWTIPLSFMDLIPNSTSGSGTIFVDTYSGSTFIGTKSCGFTARVPIDVKPTCSMTLEDVTGADDIYGSPVKGLSRIKVTVKTTTAYSSIIASYNVSIDGNAYGTSVATSDVLKTAGTSRVTVTVTDSRGRTATTYYDMNVQDYTGPVVSGLTVNRCDEDGTENEQGEFVKATFSAAISSLNSKNTATYTLRHKKTTESNWTTVNLSSLSGVYKLTNQTYIFAGDGNSSHDVEITATDRHGTATRSTSVSTAFTLINWGADGTSMALGKVAEKANTLDVALDAEFRDRVIFRGNHYSTYSKGTSGSEGFVLIARVAILSEYVDAPITFVFNRRRASAPMQVHLRFKSATSTDPELDAITYEGDNYDAYTVKLDTSTWGVYVKKVEKYDEISIQDWYTSHYMGSKISVTFPDTQVGTVPQPYYKATPAQLRSLLDFIYPVGSIYLSYSHYDPAEMFGGTWTRIVGAFLWATDASGIIGKTGGERNVHLEIDHLPAHSHGSVYSQHAEGSKTLGWFTTGGTSLAYGPVETGGNTSHNNMPPYIQVSVWRRTA